MFTLTTAAAQQIRQAASTSGVQAMALRIAASVAADGSLQYGMGFDDPGEFNFIFIDTSQSRCDTERAAPGGCSSDRCGGCASTGRTH